MIATRLLADYMGVPAAGDALARTFGAKPEKGAETIVYLASSPGSRRRYREVLRQQAAGDLVA